MTYPLLARAPIVEAIVDVRITPELAGAEKLESFAQELIAAGFPDRRNVYQLAGSLALNDTKQATFTNLPTSTIGFALWTADKRRVVQARTNGFSMSHLQPYDRWEALRADAITWWSRYKTFAEGARVSRCALRFVNRIVLPLPVGAFEDYLRTFVHLAPGLPQTLTGLFARAVVPFGDAACLVTFATEDAAVTPGSLPLFFDIDAFREADLAADADELWTYLEELRTIKNDVFFKSLTSKALELFR